MNAGDTTKLVASRPRASLKQKYEIDDRYISTA